MKSLKKIALIGALVSSSLCAARFWNQFSSILSLGLKPDKTQKAWGLSLNQLVKCKEKKEEYIQQLQKANCYDRRGRFLAENLIKYWHHIPDYILAKKFYNKKRNYDYL